MIRKFINRIDDLALLNHEYLSDSFSFTIIYGRRRVGKTELISHFQMDKPHIYFLADKRGTSSNLHRFRKKAADLFEDYVPDLETFDQVFEYIRTKWVSRKKLIIVIDEFSYLAQMDESIPSVFQLIVDEILKSPRFYLILCGSSISMMELSTLAYSSPLYGRRTSQIKLQPMRFRDIRGFFGKSKPDELIKIFGASGGIPFYLQFFNPESSFCENVKNILFAKEAVLYAEAEILLREELREPATFMNILFAISKGATRPNEIALKSYMEVKDLPYYLDILIRLGFIKKEHPVTERPVTKKTIYRINDNFIRFWFRYILTHKDELEQGYKEQAMEDLNDSYSTYLGETFEQVSKEMLIYMNLSGKLPFHFKNIGRQWGKIPRVPSGRNNYEIDIAAINSDTNEILFCECKYQDKKTDSDVYLKLKEKAGFVQWQSDQKNYFALISKFGFTDKMKRAAKKDDVLLLTLDDYVLSSKKNYSDLKM
ncbi:MAG: ATP-binding protein [Methanosarcinales archaeon]